MIFPTSRTRRQILALLVSTALGTTLRRSVAGPLDQGIGGTGAAPPTDASDRGIGGTGVIGTIRKFGSIVVNDLRIAYPADAEVRIDGRPASVSDLKIGQIVRVAANGGNGALSTRIIDVTSEVVGPVEKVGAKQITVLGQTVSTAGLKNRTFTLGETVAVSGLRRNDGTVVASLIERDDNAPSRIAGPVVRASNGTTKIGGLTLTGLPQSLVGRRVVVEGQQEGDRLVVARATPEASLLPNVRTLSVESYVERRYGRVTLGSGFAVGNTARLDLPTGQSVRAVLTTTVGADGRLTVDTVQANGKTYGGSGPGGGSRGGSGSGSGNGGSGSRGGPGGGTAPGKTGGGAGGPGASGDTPTSKTGGTGGGGGGGESTDKSAVPSRVQTPELPRAGGGGGRGGRR